MQLGMIGLGRMGANMVRRLMRGGHDCVVSRRRGGRGRRARQGRRDRLVIASGLRRQAEDASRGLPDGAGRDRRRRFSTSSCRCSADGRRRHRRRQLALPRRHRAREAAPAHGHSLRRHGHERRRLGTRARLLPDDRRREGRGRASRSDLHDAVAGPATIPRTPGREKLGGTAEHGYLHCGPSGAGHFVKMVHNGIEYGMMAAYAEGLNILKHADIGTRAHQHEKDAETTPLRHPEHYQYDFNLADITELWRRGSVVELVAARPDGAGARGRSRTSISSAGRSPIPAKGAGRSRPPMTSACRRTC